jgi:hypothetical protein
MHSSMTRDEYLQAISAGMERAIRDLFSRAGYFDVPDELFYDAIRRGVRDAVCQIAVNSTSRAGS